MSELVELKKAEQSNKPLVIDKIFDTLSKILIIAQTKQVIKPLYNGIILLLKSLPAPYTVNVPENYFLT